MVITFEGCGTPEMIERLTQSCDFFADKLISKRMSPYVFLDIIIRSNMREHGICSPIEFNTANKARGFEIELRKKKSLKSMISTLAHEMVHVKQYALGEINENNCKWKGKNVNVRKVDYFDLPWEEEAYRLEHVLLAEYLVTYPLSPHSSCIPA